MSHQNKTHSGAKKRFKKTAQGLIKASHQGRLHLLTKKTRKRKRGLRAAFYLLGGDHARVTRVL